MSPGIMSHRDGARNQHYFSPGGLALQATDRLGIGSLTMRQRCLKLLLLAAVTWLPLLLLSILSGRAWSEQVPHCFFHDIDVQVRFLITLPLLEIGGIAMMLTLGEHVRYFEEQEIIRPEDRGRFGECVAGVKRVRDSLFAEVVFVVVAIGLPIYLRAMMGLGAGDQSWERSESGLTPAGWWQVLVSLPVLYVFLLRRAWVFLLWAWFLFRISKFRLNLVPTHPDKAGGLGFVGRSLIAFSLLVMAISSIFSAGLGDEIVNHGQSLNELKYHVALFVILAVVILHLPLLLFVPHLIRTRYEGLYEFSNLVLRYDRAFDKKWFDGPEPIDDIAMLGHDDIQSLAGIAVGFEHASEMRAVPWDRKTFSLLTVSAFLPMLPLICTQIPVTEIVMKLGELLA